MQDVPVTLHLPGRILPDPRAQGDVEASLVGRIEVPAGGLPVLGENVIKGQVLAFVTPTMGVLDRTQVRREVARLTTEIRTETEGLELLKEFHFVPFRDGKVYQAERRLDGLRRERSALLPALQTREVLRASTDGVLSRSNAVAGRIVNPGTVVFEIVNPHRLWVEAVAADPAIAEVASRVSMASAITPEGQMLSLNYVGSGLTLKEQSAPIVFRIDRPPEGLRVGRPVTVTVISEMGTQRGLLVPREAITIGSDGLEQVWEQAEAEVFLPHAVRTRDVDGSTVLVVGGLKDGCRVVVQGARLMAQLQ
jgi:hypothetical protein